MLGTVWVSNWTQPRTILQQYSVTTAPAKHQPAIIASTLEYNVLLGKRFWFAGAVAYARVSSSIDSQKASRQKFSQWELC